MDGGVSFVIVNLYTSGTNERTTEGLEDVVQRKEARASE